MIELGPADIFVGCFTRQSAAASTPAVSGSPPASTAPGECPFLPAHECAPPNPLPPPAAPSGSFAGTPRQTIRSVPSWAHGLTFPQGLRLSSRLRFPARET